MSTLKGENIIFNGEDMVASIIDLPIKEGIVEKIDLSLFNEEEKTKFYTKNQSAFSTRCYRNYIGDWEIKDGKLYLLNIIGIYKLLAKAPIFADWFTGTITISSGKTLKLGRMGRASILEFERVVKIENGIVKDIKLIDNKERAKKEGWKIQDIWY